MVVRWAQPQAYIEDEDHTKITINEMLDIITKRSGKNDFTSNPTSNESWFSFHNANNSIQGPNGLVRSKIDGRFCIGHGPGTYDYFKGEFS